MALGLQPLQFPDWAPNPGRRAPRVADVQGRPEPSSPTPGEADQQELPVGGPSSEAEPTPGTPKRKRKATAKPAKPVTAPAAAASPRPSNGWKWAVWAVIVTLVAVFSRARLRSGGHGPASR